MTSSPSNIAGRIAFAYPDFVNYQVARFFIVLALEMQSVAVGWQIYDITRRPFDLGMVGLVQFLPGIILFLVSGHTADLVDRRKLLTACYAGFAVCSGLLLASTILAPRSVYPIYAVLVLIGMVRSFYGPVSRSLLPQLVPEQYFSSAVAWNSTFFQTANVVGPAIGGLIYAAFHGAHAVYAAAILTGVTAVTATLRIKLVRKPRPREKVTPATVLAGLRYIRDQHLVLGAISLDLFAVLLGGAVALLPVYAREILVTGPWGLGILRSAPAVGAASMAMFLAYRPLRRRAGEAMLWCVAAFGLFTVIFGLSRSIVISFLALSLAGAADMVSVVVRATLVMLGTPDEMRGRVNAVDMMFIGASNELGQFESGLAAQWLGTVPAVVAGGIGTILITAVWAWRFPELRKVDRLPEASA